MALPEGLCIVTLCRLLESMLSLRLYRPEISTSPHNPIMTVWLLKIKGCLSRPCKLPKYFTGKISYMEMGNWGHRETVYRCGYARSPSWPRSVADFGTSTLLAAGPKYAASGTSRSPAL